MVNEKIVGQLSDYLESQGIHRTNADGTANKDYASFMVAGSTLAGAGVGALTGGGKAGNIAAGANIAGTATVNNYLRHDQWDALAAKLSACAGQASCEAAVNATYSGLSQLQDNALATCDSRGDCAKLIQDVQAGSARQQQLVQSGALTDNYLGAANLQAQGVKLTNDAGYRNQVAQSVTAAYVCKSDPGQCTRQAAYAVLGLAALVGGGAAAAIVLENAPQIAAAASLTIKACLQNMALCANQAGLTVADFLAADALGGASVAGGAAVVGAGAGKVVGGLGGEGKGVVGIKGAAAPELSVIGRVKDLQNLSASEKSLLDRLPYMGSPKANWAQNSGVLRQEMGRGLPIRDASPLDITGQFLNAERNLLMDRAWTFDRGSNLWMPPTP